MAAITKRLFHLRPTFHSHARPHPYTLHHFSSSSDSDGAPQSEKPQKESADSSSLNAVRASLRNLPPPPDRRQPPGSPFSFFSGETPQPSRGGSRDEISSRLAEFRSRSAPPPPGGQYVSLEKLYENSINSNGAVNPGVNISESWSVLKNKADPNANLAGGSGNPFSHFLMKGKMERGAGDLGSRKVVYGKTHDLSSLGEKLKKTRPEKRKGKWFSLQELSDRLAKVRVADKKELERAGLPWEAFYQSIEQKKDSALNYKHIGLLASMVPETGPPKDHLVEKYFHPDNMSSAEKMKLELQKVRDEFKMSESDCGSARVQVAQLTTRIKHLSTALHKKDKHSRKGLHEMVQRRKKLLKYLRRTDWDSYCLVLSKLGLRDNPDVKA